MIQGLFNSTSVPILEKVAQFAEARHQVLAGNIANMDTPGYKIRDLSLETFQERLKQVIETQRRTGQPQQVGDIHDPLDSKLREVKDSMKHILFHDKSDLSLEKQVAAISNNQHMHTMAIALLNSQFRLLSAAITERV
jgi:flagellar basal-body rod protein FlgB